MRKLVCLFIVLAGILLYPSLANAQATKISGVVLSQDKTPVEGVTVTNKATGKVATTNAAGVFSIEARPGQLLTFTYVGMAEQQATAGSGRMTITLSGVARELDQVVVAMDIRRNPKELGYSVQKVAGKEIRESQRENFLNSLQGRVAGATVTPTTGQAGASASIVLRGFNSLSLSNQPLFVIDGVIMDNNTFNETSDGGTGVGLSSDRPNRNNDYTNRIADLNPNDIESVTVLKGPEATALYGSQASSGAIVITTRKPKLNSVSVSYDNSFRTQTITRFNKTVDAYSIGNNGVYSPAFSTTPAFFGPALGASTRIYDNKHNFFNTGFTQTHNLSVDLGTKNSAFRISASYIDQSGVVPSNTYNKLNLRIANTTKIGKYLDFTPSFSYIPSTNNKPLRGAGGYLLNLYTWPSDNDIRNYISPKGHKQLINPADGPNTELDNPLFNAIYNKSRDKTDRIFATFGLNIYPFPWLTISGRFGYDHYKTDGYTFYHPESSEYSAATGGWLDNYYRRYTGYNHTITATAKKSIGKFSGRLLIGTMWENFETKMFAVSGNKLIDSTSTDSSNTLPSTRTRLLRNVYGQPNLSINRNNAYFGEVSLGYNEVLFLTYSHRFEQSSVFPKSTRNYNYPGLSLSAIISDMLPAIKSGDVINFLKLRASLAQTARLPDPYSNQSVFVNSLASGQGFAYGFTNSNPYLKPERQKTYETGFELRMWKNRITLEGSYYNTRVSDQIIQGYRASYATGFVLNTSNVAATRNEGIELSLAANPVKTNDWNWNILFNFNKMFSKVLSLPASLTDYYLGDTQLFGTARAGLHKGGPTTTISGYHYARNNRGDILINPVTGLPNVANNWVTIGDRNPNFTLGTTNNITYKNWTLSFLWDLKIGGDIYNGTDMFLTEQGKSIRTADRQTPRVVKGVLADGQENSAHPTVNNIVVTPYFQNDYYSAAAMPDEEFIEKNVNWFRLRDITLSYNFSQNVVRKLKYFKSLGVFVTANDLLLFTNYSGPDPAINGNTAASKGIGSWGMDYGSLPAPVSINIGLRTSF
ncbi:SusC/RagA family TonB-linked outer membrane protein [Deminuibacter soli]|uniref:SusC/RagA family TonB-linked outer membrane protein n=1 Tax=Deminuibacter soli TaxID=2291815 RepID=A0A3E1NGX6_9BACT|nr:SusC/RagA family TonB-linked outer membrane protein [Deminuibacter soli]RFM27104.1 SusC/RagA family TonB-linked outer membrane protein [Deminuibacter soli]